MIWTLRHHVARWLVLSALRIMPKGRARAELSERLWVWNTRVKATLAAHGKLEMPE